MNWAVVMAGGPGTRFWPLSRRRHPKPFLRLLGPKTLLEETVDRLVPLFPPARILIVLQAELANEARHLLPRIPRENILGEPMSRNTAPCCVWAAGVIGRRDPDARFVFLPSDQRVEPKSVYQRTLRLALSLADERPVLLGFHPTFPSPSYGYLELKGKKRLSGGIVQHTVRRFHEKPSPAKARAFLKKGNFLWNGGTFAWRLGSFKEAIHKHLPRLHPAFEKLASFSGRTGRTGSLGKIYRTLSAVSLDYGVMEKMKDVHCLRAPLEWNDLGGWTSISEFWPEDPEGNRVAKRKDGIKPLLIRSCRNIVSSEGRLVALLGVKDLVVVETRDALLVCSRSETEQIREVVRELKKRGETSW